MVNREDIEPLIILNPDEKIAYIGDGGIEQRSVYEVVKRQRVGLIRERRKKYKVEEKEKSKGALVITNQRILFFEKRGVFGKSFHATFEIPLEEISSLSIGGVISKYLSVSWSGNEIKFNLQGSLEEHIKNIQIMIKKRKENLQKEKEKSRVQFVLDFSFLKQQIEKGGLMIQQFKCPQCGGNINFPDTGVIVECPFCHINVKAEDVFEKIKGLLK